MRPNHTWVVVLAAGEGTRLRRLTTNNLGDAIPKQYCSLRGGNTLLVDTLARAESVASADHICVIVAAQHRQWWQPLLEDLPTLDFSSHFLSGAEALLKVFDVERCGWNDLGTPARLALTLRSLPKVREESIAAGSMAVGSPHALINLSLQYSRLEGRSP